MSDTKSSPDLHGEAGEYVLGLLSHEERARFEARMARDPALARSVAAWEDELARPLVEADLKPQEPPSDLWDRIDRAIDDPPPADPEWRPAATWSFSDAKTAALEALGKRLRRWQIGSALAGGLAAAALAVIAFVPLGGPRIAAVQPLGVLIDMDGRPSWTVFSASDGSMIVEPLPTAHGAPASIRDGEFVLWAVGEGVRPLGVIDGNGPTVIDADIDLSRAETFAISVEPHDATDDADLTGEVVFLSM